MGNNTLQDIFLNAVRKQKIPVALKLNGGSHLEGVVRGTDNFTIVLDVNGKQTMVYKHAIVAVTAQKPVKLTASLPTHKSDDVK